MITRIQEIEIKELKNVKYGKVTFPNARFKNYNRNDYFNTDAEIIGVYGQNGSGKTALIDALEFIERLLSGKSISNSFANDLYNYINCNSKKLQLSCTFSMQHINGYKNKEQDNKFLVFYKVTLDKEQIDEENLIYVSSEALEYKKIKKDGNWSNKSPLLNYSYEFTSQGQPVIGPEKAYHTIIDKECNEPFSLNIVKIKTAAELSIYNHSSFLFSKSFMGMVTSTECNRDIKNIMNLLQYFAKYNMLIINKGNISNVNSLQMQVRSFLPIFLRLYDTSMNKVQEENCFFLNLLDTSLVPDEILPIVMLTIEQINILLLSIIPDLQLKLEKFGVDIDREGKKLIKVDIFSVRGQDIFSVKYESDGIKKLIGIINSLIAVYNDPRVFFAIDELDSGVHEYLIGELLRIINQHGRGQLLFTSHNLRPLEVLDKNSIYFSTSNPRNRYIRLKNVQKNHNLRDLYYRGIKVGGQEEELFCGTNPIEIKRAFRMAGELVAKK
jgi:AAA15 family ATPase/GTPase